MSREDLIARKGAVRGEITQVVRQLEQTRSALAGAMGPRSRFLAHRVAELEARLQELTTEESQLRLAIDRAQRVLRSLM